MDRAHHDPSRSPSAASQDGAGGAPRTNGRIGERTGRTLLRKLRDLDLRVRGLSVDAARRVRLEGCLSPDAPIEDGLTYRLRLQDGSTAHLDLAWREGALELGLAGAGTYEAGAQPNEVVFRPACPSGDGDEGAGTMLWSSVRRLVVLWNRNGSLERAICR